MSLINTKIDKFTRTPSRQNPATFSEDMDIRLSEENTRILQMNNMSDEINKVANEINNINNEIEINKNIVQESRNIVENNTKISTSIAKYKGEYDENNSYSLGDCISFSNSRYISKIDDNSNLPTDSSSWLKIGGIMSNGKRLGDFIIYKDENVALINPITFTSLTIGSGSRLKLI